MATVTGITKQRALQIESASIASGEISPSTGHLLLKTRGGNVSDAGQVVPDYPVTPVPNQAARDSLDDQFTGRIIFRLDLDCLEVKHASEWRRVYEPNEANIWRPFGIDVNFTNNSTFSPIANTAERNAFKTTMTKRADATKLAISLSNNQTLLSGGAQLVYCGVRVNGSDYHVARVFASGDPNIHLVLSGERQIPDIPAGTVTIEPVFAAGAVSQVRMYNDLDILSYTVREV